MLRHYTVKLLESEEGFSAWVPGLPGCRSQGETEPEALDHIREAIREYLMVAEAEDGQAETREVEVTA